MKYMFHVHNPNEGKITNSYPYAASEYQRRAFFGISTKTSPSQHRKPSSLNSKQSTPKMAGCSLTKFNPIESTSHQRATILSTELQVHDHSGWGHDQSFPHDHHKRDRFSLDGRRRFNKTLRLKMFTLIGSPSYTKYR